MTVSSVFGWGYNYFNQISDKSPQYVLEPTDISVVPQDDDHVEYVVAGGHCSGALTRSGKVFIWGQAYQKMQAVPRCVNIPVKINVLSAGNKHLAAVSPDGQVFTWGCGLFGRLGHGCETNFTSPKRVEYLWGACRGRNENGDNFQGSVFHVSCGGSHTAVVTTNGLVFMWGFNRYHQCSGHDARNVLVPRRLNLQSLENEEYVTAVFCGKQHAMLLTQNGTLYSWGQATHYRLGLDVGSLSTRTVCNPKKVSFFSGESADSSVFKIATGAFHTLVLTCNGDVYSWGKGCSGQLGHGTLFNQKIPKKIQAFENIRVSDIQVGDYHSMAIAVKRQSDSIVSSPDEVWAWGIGYGGGGSSPGAGFNVSCEDIWATPRTVPQFQKSRCMSASCGGAHTVTVVHSLSLVDEDSESLTEEEDTDSVGVATDEEQLFSLCRHDRLEELSSFLDTDPSGVHKRDSKGNTLLIIAAQNGLQEMTKLLLKHGAQVNAQNEKQNTALHFAFTFNYLDVFDTLISHGADDCILNANGLSCYEDIRAHSR